MVSGSFDDLSKIMPPALSDHFVVASAKACRASGAELSTGAPGLETKRPCTPIVGRSRCEF